MMQELPWGRDENWGQGDFPFLSWQLRPPSMKIEDRPQRPQPGAAGVRPSCLTLNGVPHRHAVINHRRPARKRHFHPQMNKGRSAPGWRWRPAALAYNGADRVFRPPLFRPCRWRAKKGSCRSRTSARGWRPRGGNADRAPFSIVRRGRPSFVFAHSEIDGDMGGGVANDKVEKPAAVRLAGWAQLPYVNLWNKDGCPRFAVPQPTTCPVRRPERGPGPRFFWPPAFLHRSPAGTPRPVSPVGALLPAVQSRDFPITTPWAGRRDHERRPTFFP